MTTYRSAVLFACLALVAALTMISPSVASGQPSTTPWGDPDLQGIWDFRTITPLQRPEDLADRKFLTEDEAATREQEVVNRNQGRSTRHPDGRRAVKMWARTTTSGWIAARRWSPPDARR